MFGKKSRLVKVVITLKHGDTEIYEETRQKPDIVEEIDILPGQSFHAHIGYYEVREHRHSVRIINLRAGYTEDIELFYQ